MKQRIRIREVGLRQPAVESSEDRREREFREAVDSITEKDVKRHTRREDNRGAAAPQQLPDKIAETVDLHGLTVDEATRRLAAVVRRWRGSGQCVRAIVGKGHHSPQGVGVLREAIPAWLDGVGHRWVAEWRWARPNEGGDGAIVARLRRKTGA